MIRIILSIATLSFAVFTAEISHARDVLPVSDSPNVRRLQLSGESIHFSIASCKGGPQTISQTFVVNEDSSDIIITMNPVMKAIFSTPGTNIISSSVADKTKITTIIKCVPDKNSQNSGSVYYYIRYSYDFGQQIQLAADLYDKLSDMGNKDQVRQSRLQAVEQLRSAIPPLINSLRSNNAALKRLKPLKIDRTQAMCAANLTFLDDDIDTNAYLTDRFINNATAKKLIAGVIWR